MLFSAVLCILCPAARNKVNHSCIHLSDPERRATETISHSHRSPMMHIAVFAHARADLKLQLPTNGGASRHVCTMSSTFALGYLRVHKLHPAATPCRAYRMRWKEAVQRHWQEEALNVYLSGRAALEDGGFGDKFEMPLTCNTLLFWLWATKSGRLKLVTSDCRNVQLPRNHMT